jgi:hypothetical protein
MAISHATHNHPTTPAGRAACRDAANIALADAVDALRNCGTVVGGSPEFVALANAHEAACTIHATLTNTTIEAVVLKVGLIVSMLPRR